MTDPVETDASRTRLNVVLWVVALLCATSVIGLSALMWNKHSSDEGGFGTRLGNTLLDKRAQPVADIGDDVGKGVVQALPASSPEDQQRIADVLTAASKMFSAFVTVDWQHVDEAQEAVRSMSTGTFLKQYNASTKSLKQVATRGHSISKGEVVWTAYVGGDADSASVILVSNGTVQSTVTKNQPVARNYRTQLGLQKTNGRWLVNSMEFVS